MTLIRERFFDVDQQRDETERVERTRGPEQRRGRRNFKLLSGLTTGIRRVQGTKDDVENCLRVQSRSLPIQTCLPDSLELKD